MNDLNTQITAISTARIFCDEIINDPNTPKEERIAFEDYKMKLTNQQKINIANLASNCE
jgi:uncharacterized protein (UPF0147 family)